ncbi:Murein DD-endopeptidase MepM and murein hydrolase activator NlpD, contain LysM domain [Balnearium lithotrophicum]|uniref:Murein DD-endopeptidase MepM and murein hydrolase activator NlpD, contain LysM domain n=1 Tax=Balnearium lithotrophicum TaxID=223788 RepID=A0A521DMV7_9BACT|nr:LysM peptidoglycan-binding domain-containing protein [Balnearium lithotrophicum]SMO72925.1 Murein DD-endopeptidase MepM and murein hydrolase activator NlpD, contain LysM domain [Balnearium lithotrophicum]
MRIFLLFISLLFLTSQSNADVIYRVKRGDTLGKIAKRYRVSVSEIKRINGIRGNTIYVGQKLRIPRKKRVRKTVKYITYRVKRGDSLLKISKKFGVPISKIKRINRLRRSTIYVSQKLKIPVKVKSHNSLLKKTSSRNTKSKKFVPNGLTKVPIYKYYRVRRGDSVLRIAKRFHVSPRTIIRINRLRKPYILRPGQRLKILIGYKDVLKLNRPIQFRFPLDGKVDTTVREDGYPGIFILSRPGAPVKAAETGIVKFAGKDSKLLKAYGNLVIIQHPDNYQSIYANLDKVFVKPNQIVKRGEIIGTAGTSGVWHRSGLYFDINRVYKNRTYHIQPLEVLK